jgi:NADPH:quinone reductase-like Zn-dependent oxidoreductase
VCYGISSALSVGRLQLLLTFLLLPALMLLPDGRAARLYGIGATAGAGMEAVREDLRELLALLAAGRLRPVVAERIPLSEVARAHELVEHGRVAGKVVLVP